MADCEDEEREPMLSRTAVVPVAPAAWLHWLHSKTFIRTPEVDEALVEADGGRLVTLPDGRKAKFFQYGTDNSNSEVMVYFPDTLYQAPPRALGTTSATRATHAFSES